MSRAKAAAVDGLSASSGEKARVCRERVTRPTLRNYESRSMVSSTQKKDQKRNPLIIKGRQIKAIVAPNYEPKEAGPIYAWAYKELREAMTPDVFVVIGTCHTELEHGIAITDKDFETPLGVVPANRLILDHFRANGGTRFFDDDIRHEQEHSVEFQLPFLQHAIGSQRQISIVQCFVHFPRRC